MGDWVPPEDSATVRKLRGRRRDHRRQDEHARARASCPSPSRDRFGPTPQPVGHQPYTGRLVRRQRRGGRVRDGFARARQRRRRLDPDPRLVLRARRAEADARARVVGAASGPRARSASRRTACSPAPCSTRATGLDVIHGYEPGDSFLVPPPSATFVDAVAPRARRAADGVHARRAERRARRPGVPAGRDGRRRAARVARPRGRGGGASCRRGLRRELREGLDRRDRRARCTRSRAGSAARSTARSSSR